MDRYVAQVASNVSSFCLLVRPSWRATSRLPANSSSVGKPRIPKRAASSGCWSPSTFAYHQRPAPSIASWCRIDRARGTEGTRAR